MTVTFCGHRTLEHPVQVKSWLREVVCDLIGQGANIFLLGGYGAFDLMAAQIVHELKAEFPDIESTLVLAYLSTDVDLRLYDNSLYPPLEDVPPRYAISRRNRWLVENSDIVVAYVLPMPTPASQREIVLWSRLSNMLWQRAICSSRTVRPLFGRMTRKIFSTSACARSVILISMAMLLLSQPLTTK